MHPDANETREVQFNQCLSLMDVRFDGESIRGQRGLSKV